MSTRAIVLALSLAASVVSTAQQRPTNSLDDLRRAFVTPPPDSRIMMRWWWFGPAVAKPEIERELQAMKAGGIGGVEVQPVYPVALDDPGAGIRNLPYLSDEFIDALRFAAAKAHELGLRFDLTLGSGWPYGGPQVAAAQAAGKLRIERVPVTPQSRRVAAPSTAAGERFIAAFLDNIDLGAIEDGAVRLPERHGAGDVRFFIASRTGMMVKRAALGAEGFVLNHYDRGALDVFLQKVGDRLLQAFDGRPPFAIFCDSLEVYDSDWTTDFLEQFRARRGYDLTPHLPALASGAGEPADAIRHDWGQTLTELLDERFVEPLQNWARTNRTRLRMQAYGIPPATLATNARVDLPEGEGVQWKSLSSTRWATSASHVYDRPITSSETWTWLHSPSFRATPLDMKAEADLHFLQGVNQLIGHGWPYTAEGVDYPGWRFYAAAVFNDRNPWWTVMPDVSSYLQRVSFMMRQGTPLNGVAIYLPTDDAWAHFSPGHVSTIETLRQRLGNDIVPAVLAAGFAFDFVDDQAIRQRAGSYRAVILPGVERMPVETLRALDDFARRGGLAIATRRLPSLAPGFSSSDADHAGVRGLAEGLFRAAGARGVIVNDERGALATTLAQRLAPDVTLSPASTEFGFVHRHTETAEVYFIANTGNQTLRADAQFRVQAMAAEWWNPMNGAITPAQVRSGAAGVTTIALDIEPYGSRVIVFTRLAAAPSARRQGTAPLPAPIDISTGWKVTFGRSGPTVTMDTLRSWTDDEATQYFSGVAAYEKSVTVPDALLANGNAVQLDFGEGRPIPQERLTNGMRAWLDPPVREAATVFVNGRRAGSLWAPPYRLTVTEMLRPGPNAFRIEVANVAINHMAGRALPDYRLLNLRYGTRFEPQDMDKVKPVPAGLTGPIRLVSY